MCQGFSHNILTSKTWQYFLKYGSGVRCFSLLSSLLSWAFLVGYVPLLALVFVPLQFTVVVLVILTAATYPTTFLDHRRFALRSLSFA